MCTEFAITAFYPTHIKYTLIHTFKKVSNPNMKWQKSSEGENPTLQNYLFNQFDYYNHFNFENQFTQSYMNLHKYFL